MPIVPEDKRLTELKQLGISESLVRLAAGEHIHEMFAFRCQAPPWYVYHQAETPKGPFLVPLWDCCDGVTGVWRRDGQLEFLEFDIEAPEEYRILAHTEQGFLATLFLDLWEDHDDLQIESFREPAQLIGFHFLDDLVLAYEKEKPATYENHQEFQQRLVARIDRG